MFDLPKATEIRKPIHKKLIYSKFPLKLKGTAAAILMRKSAKLL